MEDYRKVADAHRRNNTLRYFFSRRNRTVIGWRAGESRKTSAEGESGKPRISQAKGQR